jgi:DNA-binding NtrC family response regulator
MQTKILFVSDNLSRYHGFIRRENGYDYSLELLTHAEANQRSLTREFYDLFIIDVEQQWLALPPWVVEQSQQHYFHQYIFISDKSLSGELENLLNKRIFKIVKHQLAEDILPDIVNDAREHARVHQYPATLEKSVPLKPYVPGLLGNHPSIKGINKFIEIIGRARHAPCLIRGERGSGKQTCAKLIHNTNDLRDNMFFVKDCEGATATDMLSDFFGVEEESELHGPKRIGLFKQYSGGTIVLKNIEKMNREVQAKLLLFLEDRLYKPIGGKEVLESKVRLIGTTKFDLEWFVKHQGFNPGLYFHLKAFEIALPPVRERREDIDLISNYYMQYFNYMYRKSLKRISTSTRNILKEYRWPGNVKEIKDVMEKAVFICSSEQITSNELPDALKKNTQPSKQEEQLGNCSIRELERIHIEHVLQRTKGNKSKAAGILEISRTTLREKMKQFSLDK